MAQEEPSLGTYPLPKFPPHTGSSLLLQGDQLEEGQARVPLQGPRGPSFETLLPAASSGNMETAPRSRVFLEAAAEMLKGSSLCPSVQGLCPSSPSSARTSSSALPPASLTMTSAVPKQRVSSLPRKGAGLQGQSPSCGPELTHLFCNFYDRAGGCGPGHRTINRPQALGMFGNGEGSPNPQTTAKPPSDHDHIRSKAAAGPRAWVGDLQA